jgi:hypothetical protein
MRSSMFALLCFPRKISLADDQPNPEYQVFRRKITTLVLLLLLSKNIILVSAYKSRTPA